MSLARKLLGAEYRSGLANPAGWLVDAFSTSASFSGQRVTSRDSLGQTHVWSAVNLICGQVAQLPLKVYRELPEDGGKVEAPAHRAWKLLHDKPNSAVPSAGVFWATLTAHLLLYGNAFLEKTRDPFTGLVDELWLLDPASTVIEWDARTRSKRYYQDTMEGRKYWSVSDVLHVYQFSLDGIMGLSPIAENRQTIGTALAREQFEGGFYKRGAVMAGVLEHPGTVGKGVSGLREQFASLFAGSGRSFQTPVLEEGMTYKPLTMHMNDLQFVESKQLSAAEIANIFNIPHSYLGGSTGESLTYKTVEGNKIQLAQTAVAPRATTIAAALSQDSGIFPQTNVFSAEFVMEGLLRGDSGSRASFYKSGIDTGWMLKSEARSRENLPPQPGIDATPAPPQQQQLLPAPQDGQTQLDTAAP